MSAAIINGDADHLKTPKQACVHLSRSGIDRRIRSDDERNQRELRIKGFNLATRFQLKRKSNGIAISKEFLEPLVIGDLL